MLSIRLHGRLLVITSRARKKMPIHRLTRVNPVRDAARDVRARKQEVIIEKRTGVSRWFSADRHDRSSRPARLSSTMRNKNPRDGIIHRRDILLHKVTLIRFRFFRFNSLERDARPLYRFLARLP